MASYRIKEQHSSCAFITHTSFGIPIEVTAIGMVDVRSVFQRLLSMTYLSRRVFSQAQGCRVVESLSTAPTRCGPIRLPVRSAF